MVLYKIGFLSNYLHLDTFSDTPFFFLGLQIKCFCYFVIYKLIGRKTG